MKRTKHKLIVKKILITTILFAVGLSQQAQNLYVQPMTGEQVAFVLADNPKITFADRVMTVAAQNFPLNTIRNLSFVKTETDGGTNIATIQKTGINLFPNPVGDELTLEIKEELQNLTFRIFDMNGRSMQTSRALSPQTVINMQHYQSGIYILVIEQGGQRIQSFQIVKQ
jgi:hypothetical protein